MKFVRGFTLLETLVALTVVAIALTAVFRALGAGTRTAADLSDRLLADWVAENRLVELRSAGSPPTPGRYNAVVVQAGRNFYRSEEVVATQNPRLLHAEIVVTRTSADGEILARLGSDLAKPAQ